MGTDNRLLTNSPSFCVCVSLPCFPPFSVHVLLSTVNKSRQTNKLTPPTPYVSSEMADARHNAITSPSFPSSHRLIHKQTTTKNITTSPSPSSFSHLYVKVTQATSNNCFTFSPSQSLKQTNTKKEETQTNTRMIIMKRQLRKACAPLLIVSILVCVSNTHERYICLCKMMCWIPSSCLGMSHQYNAFIATNRYMNINIAFHEAPINVTTHHPPIPHIPISSHRQNQFTPRIEHITHLVHM